jgi:hypothetical protein
MKNIYYSWKFCKTSVGKSAKIAAVWNIILHKHVQKDKYNFLYEKIKFIWLKD